MKKRIALALALGTTMAFGAVACNSSSTTTTGGTTTGGDGGGGTGCSIADANSNGDSGTITFQIATLQIPAMSTSADGFDLDGVTSTAADAAGCYWKDTQPAGAPARSVDNQLAVINSAASAIGLDVSKALQDAVTMGSIKLQAVITKWNNTLTDSCVIVDVQADTGSGYTSIGQTATPVTNGITPVFGLTNAVDLTAPITLPPGTGTGKCTAGTYTAANAGPCGTVAYTCKANIPLHIEGVKLRAHIVANAGSPGGYKLVTNTPNTAGSPTVQNPSMLGGYIVYWNTDSGTRPACDNTPLTGTLFEDVMQKAVCDLGQGALWSTACGILGPNLDLHDMGGTLTSCNSGKTNMTSNANAVSIGAYVGSM